MGMVVVEMTGDEAKLWRSMQKIIEQQGKLQNSIKETKKASTDASKEVASSASVSVDSIAKMASAYVSVNTAVGAVVGSLRDQIELQKEALGYAKEIAKSQASGSMNLTGLTTEQKKKVFEEAKKLQADIGFSDQKFIVDAVAAGYSAAGDIELAKSATKAAAELSRNAPEELPGRATGAVDLARGSGVRDAKANLGFALQVASISRVDDPAGLIRWLAPAVSSGTNAVPGQDKQEASKEVGAIFSELNKYANDVMGMSTKTATIDLLSRMRDFFRLLPQERDMIEAKIKELDLKKSITPVEQVKLDRADFDVEQRTRKSQKLREDFEKVAKQIGEVDPNDMSMAGVARRKRLADSKAKADDAFLDLQEALARQKELKIDVTLTPTEELDLTKLKKQQAAIKGVTDPGTVFGRIQTFQQNPDLRDFFLDNNPFGEASFKGGYRELLTKNSELAKAIEADKNILTFDTKEFNRNVAESETMTPELRVAKAKAAEEARKQAAAIEGGKPFQGMIEEKTSRALLESRRSLFGGGVADFIFEPRLLFGAAQDAQQSATIAMQALEFRKRAIANPSATPGGDNFYAPLGLSSVLKPFVNNTIPEADKKRIELLDKAQSDIAKILAEAQAPRTTESVLIERELAQGNRPKASDIKQAAAPQEDSIALLKAMLKRIEEMEKKQGGEIQAKQLEVLQDIKSNLEKNGTPAPQARSNSLREQLAGPN